MAIAIDQTTLIAGGADASASSVAVNTSATAASNTFIVLGVSWNAAGVTLSSVGGGSLTWTIDKQAAAAGGMSTAIVSAQAPSGLASGTTITATYSGAAFTRFIGGASFTGVKTSSPVDGTPPAVHSDAASGTAWVSNSATLTAGSVLVACACQVDNNFSSTPTSPSLEISDVNGGAGTSASTCAYRIEAAGGSFTVGGTWSGTITAGGATNAVAYLAAPPSGLTRTFTPIPFMNTM